MSAKIYKRKNNAKRTAVLLLLSLLISLMIPCSASAAVNGSLTFSHGADSDMQETFGREWSTAVENSLKVSGTVYYYSGEFAGSYRYYSSPTVYNLTGTGLSIWVKNTSGKSSFNYYVDGALQHSSIDWWYFDFR